MEVGNGQESLLTGSMVAVEKRYDQLPDFPTSFSSNRKTRRMGKKKRRGREKEGGGGGGGMEQSEEKRVWYIKSDDNILVSCTL